MYRLLVQGVTDYAIYMLDCNGIVTNWNAGAERAKGYNAREIVGQHFSCFYMADERAAGLPEQGLATARETGRFEIEGWRLREDGSCFWAHVVINSIDDDDGVHIGFAKIVRDRTEQRATDKFNAKIERHFRLLVQGVTDYAIYMLDLDGMITNWNLGAVRAKGYEASEIIGTHFSCFYSPEDCAAGLPHHGLATARDIGRFETEGWRLRKDGSRFWADVIIDAIYDDGVLIGFAKITRDRTEQRTAALALQQVKDNLDLTLSNTNLGVCLLGANFRIVNYNNQFVALWQIETTSAIEDRSLAELLGERASATIIREQLHPATETIETFQYELREQDRIIATTTRALIGGGWVMTFEDITDRRRFEDRMMHMAHHDALTGLPNRAALLEKLDDTFSNTVSGACALLYIDLDRFKPVNDTLGHAAGDRILKEVALRLRQAVRMQDVVGRIGGDEFVVLCAGRTGRALAQRFAERILVELSRPFCLDDMKITIGGSIGIAISQRDGIEPEILLRNADLALYEAKRSGRNCFRFYTNTLTEKIIVKRAIELRLRHTLGCNAFSLYYQPIVAFSDGAVVGFEALIRWQDSDGQFISPADFIPLAEELGLMVELGRWVMNEACREAASWPDHLTIAVNVSAMQFQDDKFTGMVREALASSGLSPHRLELEITETAILTDVPLIRSMLDELRALDIQVALDDFGTGFSSLSFLQTLPFTRIKLDRSFVRGIEAGSHAHKIIRAIIRLCADLGIDVTAEGVETVSEHALLADEKCGHFQGYLCSPARPVSELGRFLGPVLDDLRVAS